MKLISLAYVILKMISVAKVGLLTILVKREMLHSLRMYSMYTYSNEHVRSHRHEEPSSSYKMSYLIFSVFHKTLRTKAANSSWQMPQYPLLP